jgi:ribosome maturation protein SDO1
MAKVTARVKINGKHYEIHVDLDEALKVKSGSGDLNAAVDCDAVYYDLRKGEVASKEDLQDAFGSSEFYDVAKQIIERGEVQKTQEFRDSERELKIKQVVDLILRNASDQNGNPYTDDRLRRAISEISYNFDNRPAEQQMGEIIDKLKTVIPIKIETKKIKLIIPARFTGQVYGVLKDYLEKEEWLSNGDLEVIVNVPSGIQIDFFEKVNDVTHGAVQSEDLSSE